MLTVSVLLALLMVAPAFAAMPGPPKPGIPEYTNPHAIPKKYASQNAVWLARKNRFRILRRGVKLPAGCPTIDFTTCNPPPDGYTLSTSTVVSTLEPSGNPRTSWPTIPPVSSQLQYEYGGNDDDQHVTYTNYNMYGLCGPGALTNALSYWGAPVASNGPQLFADLSVKNNPTAAARWGATEWTTWSDVSYNDIYEGGNEHINPNAHRSYMMYIAWLSNPNGEWNPGVNTGVMDPWHYPSQGADLQWRQDVLNWEASGHNSSTWQNFFYTTQWDSNGNPGGGTQPMLLSDVESDLWYSGVPVVAEVNSQMLYPNWPNNGGQTKHAIAIIGYDNTSSTYTYVDSCGSGTGSGTGCGANQQQRTYKINQNALWAALNNVAYQPSTGDGGWIW